MDEKTVRKDEFMAWKKNKPRGPFEQNALLWRVKHAKNMGQDYNRQFSTTGHLVLIKVETVLRKLAPVILEVLFIENPLNELVAAFKEASTESVRGFLSNLRYLLVSEADVQISDIAYLISQTSLLTAFSYRSQQRGISDEEFEGLFPALSDVQIRLIDLNGSCPTKEIQLVLKNLNLQLVRFHRYPGINVETFENTKVLNSAVEFIVAQGVHPGVKDSGMRFLKHLKNVFPAMKNIFWDWSMMMPTLTCVNAEVVACLNELLQLYRIDSNEILSEIWRYLERFDLPNSRMTRVIRGDKPSYCPPYMFFIAGTSEKIRRLEKIVCEEQIVEPDLRHFLHIQNRSVDIYKNDNIYEFLGFDHEQ